MKIKKRSVKVGNIHVMFYESGTEKSDPQFKTTTLVAVTFLKSTVLELQKTVYKFQAKTSGTIIIN